MRRFHLRQLWRVNAEAMGIATGQNLKPLLQKQGWGRRPFPGGAAAATARSFDPNRLLVVARDGATTSCSPDLQPGLAIGQIWSAAFVMKNYTSLGLKL
jgi:hypothetical protein